MRFTILLALAASTALAQQDFSIESQAESAHARMLKKKRGPCHKIAESPDDACYFKSEKYQDLDRQTKLNQIWGKLVPNGIETEAADFKFVEFPQFFTQKAQGTFCQRSDELPKKRQKIVHSQGLVAKVRWEPVADNVEEKGLSGIYASGSDTVIMRLSETNNLYEGASGLTPSVAFKFLIDGKESANIFGMNTFGQTKSWNFFENDLDNRVLNRDDLEQLDPAGEIMQDTFFKKMIEGSGRPFGLGVALLAKKNNDGTVLGKKQTGAPYELKYRAPESIKSRFSNERSEGEWYDDIKDRIDEGEVLFEVFAFRPATSQAAEEEIKIADVRLDSQLHTSKWGDENLYFRHVNIGRDRMYWSRDLKRLNEDPLFNKKDPTEIWGNQVPDTWPSDPEEAEDKYIDQMNKYGCPFAWLLGMN